jgi:hypothetical protein
VKRVLVMAIVVVCASGGAAEARRRGGIVVINSGTDIIGVRDATAAEQDELIPDTAIGYKYDLFGLFWLDIWRSDGAFVQYKDSSYLELTPEQIARMKLRVPWGYHLPPGLLLILLGIEWLIARAIRPTARSTFILAGALGALSIVFLIEGSMQIQFASTAFVGLAHALAAWRAMRTLDAADEPVHETGTAWEPDPRRAPAEPPPRVDPDPFRAPPAPAPLQVVAYTPSQQEAPIVHDEAAPAPRLLK